MTNFTPEELLSYLYNDCTPAISQAIDNALTMDWTLREKLEVMRLARERLDKATVSPRTEVVLNILDYARTAATEEV